MTRLAHVIETYAADFLAAYQSRLQPEHRQALAALRRCRTRLSPMMQLQCPTCPNQRFVPHSCGHRHCPIAHTRRLDYHPHVHLVMPAAALNTEQNKWRTKTRKDNNVSYLFNHKALAKVFRATFLKAIQAAGLSLPKRYPKHWIVDCKSVGSGEKALIYLGRYLYRGVIREQDIVSDQNDQVRFSYQNAKTKKREQRSLAGADFLWLILQHVLPKGFHRARNFGFLHPNCKRTIALLQLILKFDPSRLLPIVKARPAILCSCCGAVMQIVQTQIKPWLLKRADITANAAPSPLAA